MSQPEFRALKDAVSGPNVHTEAVQAALAKHKERKMAVPMPSKRRSLVVQTSMDAYTPPENHSAPPDVTTYTSEHSIQVERPQGSTARVAPKYGNAELMETGDGVPVSSRVSAKIQQLVNTLKRPKRPPLREFFVDDFEELLEVQQPDPNQPKPEGAQMLAMRGEQLGVVTNWPPSLEAALQRWGTISPKAPCLTTMDTNGKPLYILTYDKRNSNPKHFIRDIVNSSPLVGFQADILLHGKCPFTVP
ncbi:hypothetical protein llap_6944 [Limosa lapponica baueri]|uniref:Uncharacterized protein n=1 Tax=Limosa lapponica baueri TaxID=1758121 RepID=A0A2I0U9K8_LIMLA|nr:hypothetical protein llap_6944 [Limosa lapponica baueri]